MGIGLLILVLLTLVLVTTSAATMGILYFVAAILVVVMIHEAGHLLVAKHYDFKATKFFLGFGPTVWSFTRGETEYGIKAFPAGGFVKIVGMNPYEELAPEDRARAYPNKPRWQRALVLVAGSATHWGVAFLILLVTAMTLGFPTGEASSEVAAITRGSPAFDAGIRPGDVIVAAGGVETTSWTRIRAYIRGHGNEDATFSVRQDGDVRPVSARLGQAIFNSRGIPVAFAAPGESIRRPRAGEQLVGYLGVQPEELYATKGFIPAIGDAASKTWQATRLSVSGIGQVFTMVFGGELWDALTGQGERRVDEGPLGLVGAGRIAGQSVATGQYLNLIGLIVGFTIFVGLMNLLPLPPLDGGHLAVVAYEAVTKRTVDVRKLIPVAAAVISFFVMLFVAVLYLDIARPISVPL
jgi:membrane-associated protease RseP (regulator of RpoE activity)